MTSLSASLNAWTLYFGSRLIVLTDILLNSLVIELETSTFTFILVSLISVIPAGFSKETLYSLLFSNPFTSILTSNSLILSITFWSPYTVTSLMLVVIDLIALPNASEPVGTTVIGTFFFF